MNDMVTLITEEPLAQDSQLDGVKVWQTALGQLQMQMTQATFDSWVKDTHVVSQDDKGLVIGTKSAFAKDWLENRLFPTIQRTVANILGHSVELKFVLDNNGAAAPETTVPPAVSSTPASAPPPPPCPPPPEAFDFAYLDYKLLYFSKTGYLPVAHYHTTFWQAYLGLFNAQAYSLWYTLQKFDKRNIFKDDFASWWTPSRKISLRELTAMVGGSSTTLTGRLVPCWEYERHKIEGQPLLECCGKHAPSLWKPEGVEPAQRQCKHWKPGAIELLQRFKLLLAEVTPAPAARSRAFRFQVWRLPPLLIPAQVEQLPLVLQLRHEQWLNEYGYIVGVDLSDWEQVNHTGDTFLIERMPGHGEGRQITNNYQPNPFLPNCTTFMTTTTDDHGD